MKHRLLTVMLLFTIFYNNGCNSEHKVNLPKQTSSTVTEVSVVATAVNQPISNNVKNRFEQKIDSLKQQMILNVIKESGFIKLPLEFDAYKEPYLKTNYKPNRTSDDTLLFSKGTINGGIIGFLPDTTDYYAFLYFQIGDMLYPTIRTMDKNWQKIDEKEISTAGCVGHIQVDITDCYDSVWIYKDLKIKSISRVIGTVDIEDSISQVLNICNMMILDGLIENNGKMNIKESDLIDCSAVGTENAIRE